MPVVPGYTGADQSPRRCSRAKPTRIGYPLMIKAAHGGGGKGMRIVRALDEFAAALESCQREAKNAFGRDRVLLERYVDQPRHIEIQVFADTHGNAIHLGERECSAQRRYQKVIEESPSPFLDAGPARSDGRGRGRGRARDRLRQRRHGRVHRRRRTARFYFMEINTRLQVEHPVTETGDRPGPGRMAAARRRRRAAAAAPGRDPPATATRSKCACTPKTRKPSFLPGSGKLERLRLPHAVAHVRVDWRRGRGRHGHDLLRPDDRQAHRADADRPRALARLRDALADMRDRRARSRTSSSSKRLVRHPVVVDGTIDTGYLDRHLDEVLPATDRRPRRCCSRPPPRSCCATKQRRARRRRARPPIRIRPGRSPMAGASATPASAHLAFGCTAATRIDAAPRTAPAATTGSNATAATASPVARLADGDAFGARIDGTRPRFQASTSTRSRVVAARRRAPPAAGAACRCSSRRRRRRRRRRPRARRRCPAASCWCKVAPATRSRRPGAAA